MEHLPHVCGRRSGQTAAPFFGSEKGLVLARKGDGQPPRRDEQRPAESGPAKAPRSDGGRRAAEAVRERRRAAAGGACRPQSAAGLEPVSRKPEPRVVGRWSWGRWRSAARIGWTRVRCPLQSSAPRTAAPSFQRRLSPFEGSSSRDYLQIFVNMFLPGSHGTNNSFLFSFCQKKRM